MAKGDEIMDKLDKLQYRALKVLNGKHDWVSEFMLLGMVKELTNEDIGFMVGKNYIELNNKISVGKDGELRSNSVYRITGYGRSALANTHSEIFATHFTRILSILALVVSAVAVIISAIALNK